MSAGEKELDRPDGVTAIYDLTISGPQTMKLTPPEIVDLAAGERKELTLTMDCGGAGTGTGQTIAIHGDFAPAGTSVLSFRVQPE
jgi:hypothetical protein